MRKIIVMLAAALSIGSAHADVTLGLINDFQDGEFQSWTNGQGAEPKAPDAIGVLTTGGPAGDNDVFLQVDSSAESGEGSRLVVINRSMQWTGDYPTAGVNAIKLDAKRGRTLPATLRMAFSNDPGTNGAGGNWFVTRDGYEFTGDIETWQEVTFNITEAGLQSVSGTADFATVMGNVTEVRILVSADPDFKGSIDQHTIGLDNLEALGEAPPPGPAKGEIFDDEFESPITMTTQ